MILLTFAIRPTEYALVPSSITAHPPPPLRTVKLIEYLYSFEK